MMWCVGCVVVGVVGFFEKSRSRSANFSAHGGKKNPSRTESSGGRGGRSDCRDREGGAVGLRMWVGGGIFFWPLYCCCCWCVRVWMGLAGVVSDCDCLARSPYLIGPRETLSNARRIEQMANAQETAIAVGERRQLRVFARHTPCPGLSLFSLHLHCCLDDLLSSRLPPTSQHLLPCHLERPATDIHHHLLRHHHPTQYSESTPSSPVIESPPLPGGPEKSARFLKKRVRSHRFLLLLPNSHRGLT